MDKSADLCPRTGCKLYSCVPGSFPSYECLKNDCWLELLIVRGGVKSRSYYLVNTLYSWSLFQKRTELRERVLGSSVFFFRLSHPLRYFLSPEVASLHLPRVLRCCHLRGPGIPTIHSHFADPFQSRGWVSLCGDGPVGILFFASPLMRIVYSVSTGPKCDQCRQFSYC